MVDRPTADVDLFVQTSGRIGALEVGPVLAIEELAADKVLALFTRAQARDLVDVDALRGRFADADLLALSSEKDRGFDEHVLAVALRVASGREDSQFEALGVKGRRLDEMRDRARAWAEQLTAPK